MRWLGKEENRSMWDEAWQKARLSDVTLATDAVDRLVSRLAYSYGNGEVIFRQYRISGPEGDTRSQNVSKHFSVRDHLLDFLRRPELRENLSEVAAEVRGVEGLMLEKITAFHLIADLAAALHAGGAYLPRYDVPGEEALLHAKEFFEALYGAGGYQYSPLTIWRGATKWSSWFCNIAWDGAWYLHDSRRNIVTVLLATDTD